MEQRINQSYLEYIRIKRLLPMKFQKFSKKKREHYKSMQNASEVEMKHETIRDLDEEEAKDLQSKLNQDS